MSRETPSGNERPAGCPGLAELLEQEARGLDELCGVLERQRDAAANGDLAHVEASSQDLERLLFRLQVLTEQRRRHVDRLGGREGIPLGELLRDLGAVVPDDVRLAERELCRAAASAAHAAHLGHVVLLRLLESERAFLHSLCTGDPPTGYTASSPPAPGLVLDREG